MENVMRKPSLKNLTSDFGKINHKHNKFIECLGQPHTDSFNFLIDRGLQEAVNDLWPVEFELMDKTRIKFEIEDAVISPPRVPIGSVGIKTQEIYPTECRQRGSTYSGGLDITLRWYIDGVAQQPIQKGIGRLPIMLKSKLCHLHGKSPSELVQLSEHADEWGGYFVVKGTERLMRMLLNTRRNYPIAMKRSSWKNRDINYSDTGVQIKCVATDETTVSNTLHYLINGSATLMFVYKRSTYYTPIILLMKCLVNHPDSFIFKHIVTGFEDDLYIKGCVMEMMRAVHENGIHNQRDARNYFGKMFRIRVYDQPPWFTDEQICKFILERCILIHLKDDFDKFQLLVTMLQKLFSVVQGYSIVENSDATMFQEILLGGHLYLRVLKEKLQMWLYTLKNNILKHDKLNYSVTKEEVATAMMRSESIIETTMQTFISTGNLTSISGLGLPQNKGLSIMAENISRMRYMSHFRAVHRGSIFEEMRTTQPRQLLPDTWGFICPIHTPDGTPCGLLNHLARKCYVTDAPDKKVVESLPKLLVSLGMRPISTFPLPTEMLSSYLIMLDGRIIGHVLFQLADVLVDQLRCIKILGIKAPYTMEIVFLKHEDGITRQYPGIYLFTGPTRMMRPVLNLKFNKVEYIGTFEQVYLDISIEEPSERATHRELSKDDFLSVVASFIPMPDYNQSPRNMYQCQMGKQTMGTACHAYHLKSDAKLYRLQTPASPLFRPYYYDLMGMDDFPMGVNAIVAVISYTGYDMEDAMIINKASLERGFAHAMIYKTDFIELKANSYFSIDPTKEFLREKLDEDGLPSVGSKLNYNDIYYCYYDEQNQSYSMGKYTGREEVVVDSVRLCGDFRTGHTVPPHKACVIFRLQRNPSVGDKFASRAGQKGIFSYPWRMEDLPFTENGLVPDIVFNPHGFPSRMTIAMMIECMAGKAASTYGDVHDASPFKFSEEDTAIDYFGKLLEKSGYSYYGTERMYSGVTGTEMDASIFFGVIHYQRLRHMVSDKWQVRNTGPVDVVTRQALKGRKRGGGGRVGEMERDALIAHGTSFLLQDRFVDCCDKSTVLMCPRCKTLIGPTVLLKTSDDGHNKRKGSAYCRICNTTEGIEPVGVPYILRYLIAELASVNISFKFENENTSE